MRGGFVCSFSALDDLPKRKHGDAEAVLAVLRKAGRFSEFELTPRLIATLERLKSEGRISCDPSVGYPWTRVVVIDRPVHATGEGGGDAK